MQRALCIVWDKKAEDMVGHIIMCKNENEAIRFFGDLVENKQTLVGAHPEDYTLVRLGFMAPDNDDDNKLVNNHAILMTGERMLAIVGRQHTGATNES